MLALFAIVTLFYWKLTLTRQYSWMDSPDFAYQVLPWYQFQASEFHKGHFPLWEPHLWGGQPLAGQGQPGTMYPYNWLLFLAPMRGGWIQRGLMHWYFVLIHCIAALFCFWLCRGLGRSRAASLLAGVAFALAGWMGNTDWPQMLNGAVWAPLVFLFLLRAVEGERPAANAALSGACLGMSFLSGHHQIPVFMTVASGGVWLYALWRDRRRWRAAVLFGLLLFAVSAAQTLPAYEYGKLAVRWVGGPEPVGWKEPVPYSVHAQFAMRSLAGIVVPDVYQHANPYIGIALLGFAVVGAVTCWGDRRVRVLAAVALGGLLYALGPLGSIQGPIYALVPLVEKARNTSMAIFMCHFGIIALSAYGVDSYASSKWSGRVRWTAFAFAAVVFTALIHAVILNNGRGFDKAGIAGVTAVLFGLALRSRRAPVLLVGVVVLEAGLSNSAVNFGHRDNPESLLKKLRQHDDIAAFLRSQREPVRVEIDEAVLPYNFGDWHGIDQFGGYLASLTTNIQRTQGDYSARMRFGVNFHVGDKPARPGQVEVFQSASGLKVYRNPEARPRAWSESPCAAGDRVRMTERTSGRVVVEADLACPGRIVIAETYYPGWRATVDGRAVPVTEAYGVLRSVEAPGGRHRIVMLYRPRTVMAGAALTLLGLLTAAAMAFQGRRAGPR